MLNNSVLKRNVKEKMKSQLLMVIVVTLVASIIMGAVPFITLPIMIGLIIIYKDIMLGTEISFEKLFVGYKNLNRAVEIALALFLVNLIVMVGLIFFIVPGIVLACMYSQVVYIMIKDPNCSLSEGFRRSENMMKGHKWELFCLVFSFIGHFLLVIVTFGFWVLYLAPYINMTMLAYHEYLSELSLPHSKQY